MTTKVHAVLLFVVIILVAGIVPVQASAPKSQEWMFGAPSSEQTIVGPKAKVEFHAYSDTSMTRQECLWMRTTKVVDPETGRLKEKPVVYVMRTPGVGPIIIGHVNASLGSANRSKLLVNVDSDLEYFYQIAPPNSGMNQDTWLRSKMCNPAEWYHPKKGGPTTWDGAFPPFVSYTSGVRNPSMDVYGCASGAIFFGLNAGNLAEGTHQIYVRLVTSQGDNRPAPAEAIFDLKVINEDNPLLRQSQDEETSTSQPEYGDTSNQHLDNSPPQNVAPAQAAPQQVAPTPPAALTPEARAAISRIAASCGFPGGDMLSSTAFPAKTISSDGPCSQIVFTIILPDGSLARDSVRIDADNGMGGDLVSPNQGPIWLRRDAGVTPGSTYVFSWHGQSWSVPVPTAPNTTVWYVAFAQ